MKSRFLAILVAGCLAALGGCGNDGGGGGVSLADAARKGAEESSRAVFTASGNTREEGAFTMRGRGVFTGDQSRGVLDGDFSYDGTSFKARIVMVDAEAWMASPILDEVLPAGKRWLHISDDTGAARTMTPSQFVDFVLAAGDVETIGAEKVRGRSAIHYRAVVDLEELAEQSPDEGNEDLKEMIEQTAEHTDLDLPIDVWVDDDGLIARITLDWDLRGESLKMDAIMLEYGVPVDAEPPPAGEVVEESDLEG